QLLPPAEGGRHSPISLNGTYRPHIKANTGPYLGVVIRSETAATLNPGEKAPVLLDLPYDIDYSALTSGTTFTILEGPHTVGSGKIS
ncbi:hypothetical protein, partial [Leifsonia sp. LS1]|uniref:hypothetical protein n=1 Tax=Leifsonia sp. LS1 TaxID=2828483 RepID=UPI0035B6686F